MVAALVAAFVLAVAGPPTATFEAGAAHARLAVSSWCWHTHCGAPISAVSKTTRVRRGSRVHVLLAFAPRHALVSVAGKAMAIEVTGRELTWRATRGGGLTVSVSASPGFVVYVGRLKLH
jgi:hypothetical protein